MHRAMLWFASGNATDPWGSCGGAWGQVTAFRSPHCALQKVPSTGQTPQCHPRGRFSAPRGAYRAHSRIPVSGNDCFPSRVRGQEKAKGRSDANTSSAEGR